jgi:hypothetical protein
MRRQDKKSPLEQGQKDTEIRRDTAIRGSMGKPASGADSSKVTPNSDVFKDQPTQEQVRGGTPRERPARQSGKLPLPD